MAPEIAPHDIVIAFMGPTGAGKSLVGTSPTPPTLADDEQFVDLLTTGKVGSRTGISLKAETTRVTSSRVGHHTRHGNRIVLVDTPSFDSHEKSDLDVLDEISQWLEKTYKNNVKLTGLIYLHRITDNRMGNSPKKNLSVFQKLCGDTSLDRVILVSTMWHEICKTPEIAEKRHKELEDKFWKPLIDRGSSCDRLERIDSKEAWRIVDGLIETNFQKRNAVLLQNERVGNEVPLIETQAGKVLATEVQKKLAEQKASAERLQSGIEKLRRTDPLRAKELTKEYKKVQRSLEMEYDAANRYKIPLSERIKTFFRKVFPKNKKRKPL